MQQKSNNHKQRHEFNVAGLILFLYDKKKSAVLADFEREFIVGVEVTLRLYQEKKMKNNRIIKNI